MISHRRQSPGVEFNEIDKSYYGQEDYSVTGTTTHIAGFADIGQDYITKWVNSKNTFHELYGYPTNQIEQYFFNGVCEILDRGGIVYASKLPYDNPTKDKFTVVTYSVEEKENENIINKLKLVDNSLTSYLEISYSNNQNRLLNIETFDDYRTGKITFNRNQIKIVDITGGKYEEANILTNNDRINIECLGVVPVIVGSINSMFFKGLITSNISIDLNGVEQSEYLAEFQPIIDFGALDSDALVEKYGENNFSIPLSANTIYNESLNKKAIDNFPSITVLRPGIIEQKYTKHIGLAVFIAYRDEANESKINFKLVEFFSGQLDRRAIDETTGGTDYICDKVNQNSKYINMFSTINPDILNNIKTTYIVNQTARSLGFYKHETYKHIDYKNSIVEPLTRILDRIQDPNQIQIDIMADAGITNIAQFVKDYEEIGDKKDKPDIKHYYNADMYPFIETDSGNQTPWDYTGSNTPSAWYSIMKKFDDFCKNMRKDCIFIADGFRPFVLNGNEKFARQTNTGFCQLQGTMPKLLANIRKMTVLDSSYSTGYSNWFYCPDFRTGEYFWCPPSIKAAGVYTYNDIYGHVWSAPAGANRGMVKGATDVAFNPYKDEAGEIYKQAWNYAVSYPLDGVLIEGQKTMQLQQTALDRVNVRRLMLYLERMVISVARRYLYEGNTAYNRQRFVDQITPIFDDAVQGDGILRYAIRCDDELNSTEVIENHEMKCLIGIVPVKTMEWIVCNFVIGNQSADVYEQIMK